ncbi:MAG: hypothetical protein ACTHKN_17860 [Achromobacter mucicolens]
MTTNTTAPAHEAAQTAAKILTYLGFAQAVSMEPGTDRRRDHIQSLIADALSRLRAPVADERAAFERFQRKTGLDELYLERHATHGQYMWTAAKEAWETWQARAALASAPVAGPSGETLRLAGVIADKIEDGTLFEAGIFSRRELADKVRTVVRFVQQGAPVAVYAAPQASEAVPQAVIDVLKGWTGSEPSQSVLARAVDAWLDPGAVWESERPHADKVAALSAQPGAQKGGGDGH